jgi:single-strand DNA-binding protein
MFNEAQLSVAGYVASEPELVTVGNSIPKLTMKVAWTTRRREPSTGQWVDGNTSFVRVTCWRRLAENLATCLRKGDAVLLRGRLDVRPFTGKDGVRRVSVDVEASHLGHDLTRGVAGFRRVYESTGKTAGEAAAENGVAAAMGGYGSADGESAPLTGAAAVGGPALAPVNGLAGDAVGDLDAGSVGDLDAGSVGDLDVGVVGDLDAGVVGDPAGDLDGGPAGDSVGDLDVGPGGDSADEEMFDDGAIDALAQEAASVATVS